MKRTCVERVTVPTDSSRFEPANAAADTRLKEEIFLLRLGGYPRGSKAYALQPWATKQHPLPQDERTIRDIADYCAMNGLHRLLAKAQEEYPAYRQCEVGTFFGTLHSTTAMSLKTIVENGISGRIRFWAGTVEAVRDALSCLSDERCAFEELIIDTTWRGQHATDDSQQYAEVLMQFCERLPPVIKHVELRCKFLERDAGAFKLPASVESLQIVDANDYSLRCEKSNPVRLLDRHRELKRLVVQASDLGSLAQWAHAIMEGGRACKLEAFVFELPKSFKKTSTSDIDLALQMLMVGGSNLTEFNVLGNLDPKHLDRLKHQVKRMRDNFTLQRIVFGSADVPKEVEALLHRNREALRKAMLAGSNALGFGFQCVVRQLGPEAYQTHDYTNLLKTSKSAWEAASAAAKTVIHPAPNDVGLLRESPPDEKNGLDAVNI